MKKPKQCLGLMCGEYRIRTGHPPDCHRDTLALILNQVFNIFSAFHFFNLKFPFTGLTSGNESFKIFQFPIFCNFCVFASTVQMILETFFNILARTNIIFIKCRRINDISVVHRDKKYLLFYFKILPNIKPKYK
jgi:hypothetical protein